MCSVCSSTNSTFPSKRLIKLSTRSLARRWTAISKPLYLLRSPEHLLQHDAHQGLAVGVLGVIPGGTMKAVVGWAAPAKNTPMSFRTVLRGVHNGAGFVRRVDVRHLHTQGTPIQEQRNNL